MIKGIIREDGSILTKEEALSLAQTVGNIDGWPMLVIVQALQEWKRTNPSASMIAGGTWRRSVLEQLVEYYVKLADRYALLRGSMVHNGLEKMQTPPGIRVLREKRLKAKIPKYEEYSLSGTADLYFPDSGRLEDWKTCMRIPEAIKPDHVVQLAIYAWLLRWSGFKVDAVAINYVSWDGCIQHTQVEVDGELIQAIEHPLLRDEQAFVEHVLLGYETIRDGLEHKFVPSTKDCVIAYCRWCPVAWACNQINPRGEIIDPASDKFLHENYLSGEKIWKSS